MMNGWMNQEGTLVSTRNLQKAQWIEVTNPDEQDFLNLIRLFDLPKEIFLPVLDIHERPRIEMDDDYFLFILRVSHRNNKHHTYANIPIAFYFIQDKLITITSQTIRLINDIKFDNKKLKFKNRSNFFIFILFQISSVYLSDLKRISRALNELEDSNRGHNALSNDDLHQLFALQKDLVYFTTSLKANEVVIEKVLRKNMLELDEDDQEFLESAIIENQQAMSMSNIYNHIVSNMMNGFSSLISNDLNQNVKVLTSFSIILMLLNLIFSIYGMNINLPFQNLNEAFVMIMGIAFIMTIMTVIFFIYKRLF